jgi:hypothetical protein
MFERGLWSYPDPVIREKVRLFGGHYTSHGQDVEAPQHGSERQEFVR